MSFGARLLEETGDDHSLVLIVGLLVTAIITRTLIRDERVRMRGLFLLTALHLVCLPVLAGLRDDPDGPYRDIRLAALVFEVLAIVGMAAILLFGLILPRVGVRAPRILRDVVAAVAALIAIIAIADGLGYPISGLITTSAILTAVIGFALQDTLGNVIGGLALQIDRSIRVGDWVHMDRVRGRVSEIRWRHTAIETRDWETVIVPNSLLMKGQVTVEGRRGASPLQLRRWVYFNVDFRYEPTDVVDTVDEALASAPIEHIAEQPKPTCLLMELHESYARYGVIYWLTDLAVDVGVDSVVRTRIYFALKRAEIPLSMPAHAVFLTEDTADRKGAKQQREAERRMRALSRVDLFEALDEESRARLAGRLRYAPFSRGEAMTRQGERGNWLYMIVDGEAVVRVAKDGVERNVALLSAGEFFGEMSLLTGAPRTATVVALTDVECYRLDKAAFQEILLARPEIADGVAAILARRRASLDAVQDDLDAAAREHRMSGDRTDLLHLIRGFFGLEEEKEHTDARG